MNRIETLQASFEQGIVENIKQDMMFDGGQPFNSALWISNYNPNYEHLSLVKRMGYKESVKYVPPTTSSNANPLLVKSVSADGDADGVFNNYRFFAYGSFASRNPSVNNVDYAFLSQRNSTISEDYTLVYSTAFNDNTEKTAGANGLTNTFDTKRNTSTGSIDIDASKIYRGIISLGRYSSHQRYGESILYTTLPTGSATIDLTVSDRKVGFYSTVFEWKYIDFRKVFDNNNQFLNGIDVLDASNLQKHNMWVTSSIEANISNTKNLISFQEIDGLNQQLSTTTPITVVVIKQDVTICERLDGANTVVAVRKPKEVIGLNTSTNKMNMVHCVDSSFYLTHLNIQDIYLKNHLRYLAEVCIVRDNPPYKWLTWSWLKEDSQDRPVERDSWGGLFDIAWEATFTDGYAEYEYINVMLDRQTDTRDDDDRYFALSIALPDYIKMKETRLWRPKEKIPIVVTGLVNGIEILLANHVVAIEDYKQPSGIDDFNNWDLSRGILWASKVPENKTSFALLKYQGDKYQNSLMAAQNRLADSSVVYAENVSQMFYLTGKRLWITVAIDKSFLSDIISNGITNIRVYASKPDLSKQYFPKVGYRALSSCPTGVYCQPAVESIASDTDFKKFALIKDFVINGKTDEIFKKEDSYKNGFKTNSWIEKEINSKKYLISVGQTYSEDGDVVPLTHTTSEPIWNSLFTNISTWLKGIHFIKNDTPFPTQNTPFTPDFAVWDYPTDSTQLSLMSSGKYFHSKGALDLAVIQSRVLVIGAVNSSSNVADPGLVRFSAVQGGVISKTLFNEEDKVYIGSKDHTAIIEYREQALLFSRSSHHRLIFPKIVDYTTWEFLDAVEGSGTFSKKTVISTPFGVCYCNEAGIWMTDGRMPESLTDNPSRRLAVNGIYQAIMINSPYKFAHEYQIGNFPYDLKTRFNPYAELLYDEQNNELVLCTPYSVANHPYLRDRVIIDGDNSYVDDTFTDFDSILTFPIAMTPESPELLHEDLVLNDGIIKSTESLGELRLIYNFANNNWRIEVYNVFGARDRSPYRQSYLNNILFNKYGRQRQAFPDVKRYRQGLPNGSNYIAIDATIDRGASRDSDSYSYYDPQFSTYSATMEPIVGEIVTHEIGNGIDDFLMHSVILEGAPREFSEGLPSFEYYNYLELPDPILQYELRSRDSYVNTWQSRWRDIIALNMNSKGGLNPFTNDLQTPSMISDNATGNDERFYSAGLSRKNVGRESSIYLAPLNQKFRRGRYRLFSDIMMKVRSILIKAVNYTRKSV